MNKARLFTIGLIAVGATIFFVWLTNSYVLKSQAAESKMYADILQAGNGANGKAPVTFTFIPRTPTDVISGTDLFVSVENGSIDSWKGCATLDGKTEDFTELLSTPGAMGRYSCVVLKGTKDLPKAVAIRAQVSCTTGAPAVVSILSEKTEAVGPVENSKYTLEKIASASIDCSGEGQETLPTEDILTSFAPKDCKTSIGGVCDYDVMMKSRNGKDHISGAYVKISYDPSILKVIDDVNASDDAVLGLLAQATSPAPTSAPTNAPLACTKHSDCPSPCANPAACGAPSLKCQIPAGATSGTCVAANATPTAGVPTGTVSVAPTSSVSVTPSVSPIVTTNPKPSIPVPTGCRVDGWKNDAKNGVISFVYICNKPIAELPTSISIPAKFKAIGNGSGKLVIESVQVTGPEINGPYSVHKSFGTYTVGDGTGNVTLNMKLRMQCVVAKPKGADTIKVKVGIADGGLRNPQYQTGDFKVDDKGFWNGTLKFNVPAGRNYKLLPKGEKHMQKKVCVNNPKEDYPGAYSCDKGAVTLKEGENTIDLSSIVLLSGDLPPGEQDGISNAKDQSLVRNLIGKSDPESVRLADINYDGVINAVDHSCLIAALAVRWDEQ